MRGSARDTANEAAQTLNLSVRTIPELGERNWGELEGKPRTMRRVGQLPRGAEPDDQFHARILRGLGALDPEGVPLIVSHAGVFRALRVLLDLAAPQSGLASAAPVFFAPASAQDLGWRLVCVISSDDIRTS